MVSNAPPPTTTTPQNEEHVLHQAPVVSGRTLEQIHNKTPAKRRCVFVELSLTLSRYLHTASETAPEA